MADGRRFIFVDKRGFRFYFRIYILEDAFALLSIRSNLSSITILQLFLVAANKHMRVLTKAKITQAWYKLKFVTTESSIRLDNMSLRSIGRRATHRTTPGGYMHTFIFSR